MKRAAAFFLSLTIVWLQVMASAQTLSPAPTAQPCGCCTAKPTCCCVADAAPEPIPAPAAPVSASASIDLSAVLAKVVAWTLPSTAPAIVTFLDSSAALHSAVPLFQRNCALLI